MFYFVLFYYCIQFYFNLFYVYLGVWQLVLLRYFVPCKSSYLLITLLFSHILSLLLSYPLLSSYLSPPFSLYLSSFFSLLSFIFLAFLSLFFPLSFPPFSFLELLSNLIATSNCPYVFSVLICGLASLVFVIFLCFGQSVSVSLSFAQNQ